MPYFTYILYSPSHDRYYVGQCEDLTVRLLRHNNKGVPSTRPYVPWLLKYFETFETRPEAALRERKIKQMKSRKFIEQLIGTE